MPLPQQILAILVALAVFLTTVRLVHGRHLKEEYSWLWLLTGALLVVVTVWDRPLVYVTTLLKVSSPAAVLLFLGIVFLMLLNLQYSIVLTALSKHLKKNTQEMALLQARVDQLAGREETREGQ